MDSAGNPIVAGCCIKCKSKPFTINVRYAVYCQYIPGHVFITSCRECFLDQVYHKYRIAVSRAKNSSIPERILVGYSGSSTSRLLLHLTQLSKIQDPLRQNLDEFHFTYISHTVNDMNVERFRQIMDSYSVSFEIFHLETLLFQDPSHLDKLVVSCKSATAKSDLMRILTRMALVKVAILRGFSKVFVGDNCTRLAVDIISDTCTGRGVNLPWKYATCQKYLLDSEGVVIVRPLRDLVDLEIKYYLESIIETYPETALPRLDSPKEPSDSIYALTDSITLSMV